MTITCLTSIGEINLEVEDDKVLAMLECFHKLPGCANVGSKM